MICLRINVFIYVKTKQKMLPFHIYNKPPSTLYALKYPIWGFALKHYPFDAT